MKLAVIGSINMDQVVTADRIPGKGETLPGKDLSYVSGGKGANQAVAMARLGAQVTMFGCVGNDDNGAQLLKGLELEGIDTSKIDIVDGIPTGLAVITVAENDNTIIVIGGANTSVDDNYFNKIKEELKTFDLIVLQHEIPLDTVYKTVSFCYENSIPVVLNPAPAADVPQDIVDKVTYLTPNEHEARLIFQDKGIIDEDLPEDLTIEKMLKAYPEKLIITRGARGVSVAKKDGTVLTVPGRKAQVVDTTGAGDTLNGAFSVRIAAGDSVEEALNYANCAASLSVEKFGAQGGMPTAEEVKKRMEEES